MNDLRIFASRVVFPLARRLLIKDAIINTESFMCNGCPQGYHTAKERTQHQQTHDKPYECHECNYKNIRQDHLSTHMVNKHAKTVLMVRTERKKKRESANVSSATNMESNSVVYHLTAAE